MDEATKELLESLVAGQAATTAAVSELAEALKPKPAEEAEETAVDPLAVAKALADSELSESGRERVFELHQATGKDINELIESEKAHEKSLVAAEAAESAGVEEGQEAEESASDTPFIPTQWKVKK